MLPAGYVFDEGKHAYSRAGQEVPSVTRVLDLAGFVSFEHVRRDVLEWRSKIGRYTHEWTRYYDEGNLDWNAFGDNPTDQEIKGRTQAWVNFKRTTGFVPRLIEERFVSQINGMQFGMTVDRVGKMAHSDHECVIDLKTAATTHEWYALQTAGYALGVPDLDNKGASPRTLFMRRRRMVVQLFPDGDFNKTDYGDSRDMEAFVSGLHVATWRLQHKVKIRKIED